MYDQWGFDREGRIAGWKAAAGGLVCATCANDEDGDPVTMEEAGEDVLCTRCHQRIS